MHDPIEEDYYQNNENILGNEKPTTPIINPFDYSAGDRVISWQASVDPDTGETVDTYLLYWYDKPPSTYYLYEDLFQEINNQLYYSIAADITNGKLTNGAHYFTITAYHDYRESDHSNIIEFIIP